MIKVKEDLNMKKLTEHKIVSILKEAVIGLPVISIAWSIHSKYEWIMDQNLSEKPLLTGQNYMV